MWQTKVEELTPGKVQKYWVMHDDRILAFSEVVNLWQSNQTFRKMFIELLKQSPFTAYFWETPPVTKATWNQPFEFVLINSPGLSKAEPEQDAFREHFNKDIDGNGIVSFPNLGGDAALVVPCPLADASIYTHLATFVRNAPEGQVHFLWQDVGEVISNMVNDQPTWLSTAGFGVFWLHVRLDSRPKYYRHAPYKMAFSQ